MNAVNINLRTAIVPEDVLYCLASENYTKFYFNNNNHVEIVPVTLKDVEKRLKAFSFVRVHKSNLVNLKYVIANADKNFVEMADNNRLAISRRKVSSIRKLLKQNQKIS